MVTDSRITWEKLCLELELLREEEPKSLLPILIGVHAILRGDEFQDWCVRNVNFMVYELAAQCEGKSEAEKLDILNDFFFVQKDFQITHLNRNMLSEKDCLIRHVLTDRAGAALPMAMIYIHLATQVDLPLALVNLESLNICKWLRGSKCSYLDLARSGSVLGDEDILDMVTRMRQAQIGSVEEAKLEVLTGQKILTYYLEDLKETLKRQDEKDLHHAVLSMLLKLDNNNLAYIGERALVRKELGFEKEAMADLKRYLSFAEMASAPMDIQRAFKEINAMSVDAPETLH